MPPPGLDPSLPQSTSSLRRLAPSKILEPLRGIVETWKGRPPVPVTCLMTDAHLRPDGVVVMGQLRPDHEDRAYLEHILEWHYRYRDPRDLERLFAASRFKDDALTIEQHEDGIQMRVIGRRQGRA
jgi:hypothetical protein